MDFGSDTEAEQAVLGRGQGSHGGSLPAGTGTPEEY